MADNVTANPGTGGATFATDDIGGVQFPRHKLVIGADGANDGDVSAANPLPVTGPLTDAQLRATAVPISSASLTTIASAIKAEDSVFVTGDAGIQMLAVRQDAMAALGADGDYAPLQVNATGRLKVSAEPAAQVAVTGNITGNGQTVSMDTSRTSNITIYCTGTFSTVNCAFEGSLDGTNWFGVQAIRTNANTIETTTGNLSAAPAYGWELSVNGLNNFRVRSTAWTSGTQAWRFQPAPYATEPIPGAQISGTQPVSGTVTANIGTGALAAGTNAIGDVGVQYRASATGAATLTNINCPATPAAQQLKSGAGRLVGLNLFNTSASTRWLKIFNLASASVTPGTTSALTEIGIPAGGRLEFRQEGGAAFSTGITVMITGGAGLTNNTAVTLGDVTGFGLHA